jgi:hypothetical protein
MASNPGSWVRIQEWLTKTLPNSGRIGLKIFGKFPYVLELDATHAQHGNIYPLTFRQSWLLLRARRKWVSHRHGLLRDAFTGVNEAQNLPMADWIELREKKLKEKQ